MSKVILKVENVSKQYRLGQLGTGTISHDLNRWWSRIIGKEDPYLKIGDVNDRSQAGGSDYVWSLKDINFEVKEGDVLGIIGKNGAGKSTLLKILSQVTNPTSGQIKIKGRIAALLEVGTGFHPELSGRENIFLNGTILGMTRTEIKKKLDEIIDFSGVAKYLDTPVKRYSSGMMVRLGFAVAAHLEPEILIVDEVLAVGDAEFQKKCLGKMKDVSGQGRTVLFVSHNLSAVQSLCTDCLYLANGQKVSLGKTQDIIAQYIKNISNLENLEWHNPESRKPSEKARFTSMALKKKTTTASDGLLFITDELELTVESEIYENLSGVAFELFISSIDGTLVSCTMTKNITVSKVNNTAVFTIPANILNNSFYLISVGISVGFTYFAAKVDSAITFQLLNVPDENTDWKGDDWPGMIRPKIGWSIT